MFHPCEFWRGEARLIPGELKGNAMKKKQCNKRLLTLQVLACLALVTYSASAW